MMSYAVEKDKGKWIAIFWAIFQMGNLFGSLIPLIQTVNSTGNKVDNSTCAAFLVLISLRAMMASTLSPPRYVRNAEGKKIVVRRNPTCKSEFKEMYRLLRIELWIILLFPSFWASIWFAAYESNYASLAKFSIRTRALNNLLMCTMEIRGAVLTDFELDMRFYSRNATARVAEVVLFVLTMAIWE